MHIVFVGLASNFTPGMSYQDNELARQVLEDGNRVTYISAPTKYVEGVLVNTEAEDIVLPDGMRLIRMPYCVIGPRMLAQKIRKVKGLYELLEELKPDILFSHNTQYWSILDVIRYKKTHPEVKFYADTHAASYNSGSNWMSLHVLHRLFYKYLTQKTLPHLETYFYIGESERLFALENYCVPEERMEFFPLGGFPPIKETYNQARQKRREELGVAEDELLLVHSGKLDEKKRTKDLLHAFANVPSLKARLAIIGSIPDEQKEELLSLMAQDGRVSYLGWMSGDELREYLCACDLYCQPGSASATLQNAVCCGSPVMAYPHPPYTKDLDYGNILWVKEETDITEIFWRIAQGQIDLAALREGSERCARELLDYRALAARLYQ